MQTKVPTNKKNKPTFASHIVSNDLVTQNATRESVQRLDNEKINEEDLTASTSYIAFSLGPLQSYGIEYQYINEVMDIHQSIIQKHASLPAYIEGRIKNRGRELTVVNTKKLFSIQDGQRKYKEYIIVISLNDMTIGLLVDEIQGINSFNAQEVSQSLTPKNNIKPDYIAGQHKGVTTIINAKAMLADIFNLLKQAEK